ncbi:MAG: MFS transporter, partial [Thermoplasmatota archaeon]
MRPLTLATWTYVLASASQATYVFYLTPAFTRAFGIEPLNAWAFSLAALATMFASLPAGTWSDRVGRRPVMRIGWALIGVGPLALALAARGLLPAPSALLVGAVATGVGLGLGFVAFQSYVSDLVSAARLGASYGYT